MSFVRDLRSSRFEKPSISNLRFRFLLIFASAYTRFDDSGS